MKKIIIKYFGVILLVGAIACTPTSNCTDGIQNGNETGVDCGGSCPPCVITPNCTDGIQNGNETGVDCGGSCPPCASTPNCTDGIQNGNETGVDCGGSCPPCTSTPNCTDGIQNGNETGVDCGGSCPPCTSSSSCTDGIQNGNETGIDCGGSCPPCFPFIFEFYADGTLWSAVSNPTGLLSDYDPSSRVIDVYKPIGGFAFSRTSMTFGVTPTQNTTYPFTNTSITAINGMQKVNFQYRPTGAFSSNVYIPIPSNFGSLTVTEYNTTTKTIKGTFSSTLSNGTDTIVVTNGIFTLPMKD